MPVVFNPFTGNLDFTDTTAAGGANTQVQYNDNGDLGGSANFTWTSVDDLLTVGGNLKLSATGDATTTDTGIYSPGADQLAISTGGTGRLFVDANGNVGINSNPDGTGILAIKQKTDATNGGLVLFATDGGGAVISRLTDGGLTFRNGGNERMRISSSGNVGIGTTNPASPLDVTSTGLLGPTANDGIRVYASNRAQYANLGYFGVNTTSSYFTFNVQGTERARIDSSGRLLVGTSSASAAGGLTPKLQVQGTDAATSLLIQRDIASDAPPYIVLAKTRAGAGNVGLAVNNDSLGRLVFAGGDGVDVASVGAEIGAFVDGTSSANDLPTRLVFSTTADGASTPTERLRIDSSGNVGIGTQSPSTNLELSNAGNNPNGLSLNAIDVTNSPRLFFVSTSTNNAPCLFGNDGSLVIHTGAIPGSSSGSERARIDSDGRLLVGTSIVGNRPDVKLTVSGPSVFGADANSTATIANGATATVITPPRGYSYINISASTGTNLGLLLLVFATTTTLAVVSTVDDRTSGNYSVSVSGTDLQVTNSSGVGANFYASCVTIGFGANG